MCVCAFVLERISHTDKTGDTVLPTREIYAV